MNLNDDVLEAIARHDAKLELGTGWQAEVNANEAWKLAICVGLIVSEIW